MRKPKPDRYGLMPGEREAMEAEQSNRCRICGRPPKTRRLAVDHHHACAKWDRRGSVRGLLCFRCNTGHFQEDPELMRRAADYFASHRCSPQPERAPRRARTASAASKTRGRLSGQDSASKAS